MVLLGQISVRIILKQIEGRHTNRDQGYIIIIIIIREIPLMIDSIPHRKEHVGLILVDSFRYADGLCVL